MPLTVSNPVDCYAVWNWYPLATQRTHGSDLQDQNGSHIPTINICNQDIFKESV